MAPEDKDLIIRQIMALLWKHKELPPRLQAERIFIDVLEKAMDAQKDAYERLFYTDTSQEN